jgi:enoyl-CoA hydratase/carnithine racemase
MNAAHVILNYSEHATIVCLNDPQNNNRLTDAMVEEVHAALVGAVMRWAKRQKQG